MLNYIIFILTIIYILYSSVIYKINKGIDWIYDPILYGFGLLILIITFYNWFRDGGSLNFWLLLIVTGIVGTVITNMMYAKQLSDDEKEIYINNYNIKTVISIFLFIIVGLASYLIGGLIGDECTNTNPELLCSKSFIIVFILMVIFIYYIVNFWKNFIKWGFIKDNDNGNKSDWFNILLIGLWQFYLYMIIDGFSGGSIVNPSNSYHYGGGSSYIFEMVTVMTIIYIICNYVLHSITNYECDKWKNISRVNNIKEMQANILLTTIISVIMVLTISVN